MERQTDKFFFNNWMKNGVIVFWDVSDKNHFLGLSKLISEVEMSGSVFCLAYRQ